jgi:hypothetical protein
LVLGAAASRTSGRQGAGGPFQRLAQTLSRETGQTMTQAAIHTLREWLEGVERSRRTASAGDLLAIGRRCAKA